MHFSFCYCRAGSVCVSVDLYAPQYVGHSVHFCQQQDKNENTIVHVDTIPWVSATMRGSDGGGVGGRDGGSRGREWGRDGQSCLFWRIQVSVLFDEDEVKC